MICQYRRHLVSGDDAIVSTFGVRSEQHRQGLVEIATVAESAQTPNVVAEVGTCTCVMAACPCRLCGNLRLQLSAYHTPGTKQEGAENNIGSAQPEKRKREVAGAHAGSVCEGRLDASLGTVAGRPIGSTPRVILCRSYTDYTPPQIKQTSMVHST